MHAALVTFKSAPAVQNGLAKRLHQRVQTQNLPSRLALWPTEGLHSHATLAAASKSLAEHLRPSQLLLPCWPGTRPNDARGLRCARKPGSPQPAARQIHGPPPRRVSSLAGSPSVPAARRRKARQSAITQPPAARLGTIVRSLAGTYPLSAVVHQTLADNGQVQGGMRRQSAIRGPRQIGVTIRKGKRQGWDGPVTPSK